MTSTWIGQEILGYTLTREIGSGSYGVVYLGEKKNRFGTSCRAIKRISVGEDEMSALTDVMRELETISHLTGVTNVVTYYDNHVIEAEENGQKRIHVFILMDYMTPLASHIKSADMTVGDAVQTFKNPSFIFVFPCEKICRLYRRLSLHRAPDIGALT